MSVRVYVDMPNSIGDNIEKLYAVAEMKDGTRVVSGGDIMVWALPFITPNETARKGEWLRMSDLSEQEDDRYKCSCCGNIVHHSNKTNLYTFNRWCGRCGSDNERKSEDADGNSRSCD